jgi:hypothetical protein
LYVSQQFLTLLVDELFINKILPIKKKKVGTN